MNQKLLGAEIEPPGAGGERDLARQILELVRRRDHVSFAQLQELPGFRDGRGLAWTMAERPTIVLWCGLRTGAYRALARLCDRDVLVMEHVPVLVYVADGALPDLPVARTLRRYKRPHWLPVAFRRGPRFDPPGPSIAERAKR
jgi:hypothetical protein